MTKRDSSDCKYVQIFPHRAGSKSAPSRRTVFVGWNAAKHGEVSDVTMRNAEANNIKEGRARFKATVGLREEKSIKVMPPRTQAREF
jgi:hypothetical protein